MPDDFRCLQNAADLADNGTLHHAGCKAARSRLVTGFPVADDVHRYVVAVAPRTLLRAGGCHGRTRLAEDEALQQRCRFGAGLVAPHARAFAQDGVGALPKDVIDNCIVLALIDVTLMNRFAAIDAVVEQAVEVALVDNRALLVACALAAQLPRQFRGGPQFDKAPEYPAHGLGLRFVDHQLAIPDIVAHRHRAAHPHAALSRRGELVPDTLSDHFALELSEAQQDVECEPSHRRGGVE